MENESKKEKFIRIAEPRVNKVIDALHVLEHCANTNTYEYSNEDINKIFDTLEAELDKTRRKFIPKEAKTTKFRL